jgi:hypothetical protein
MGRCFAVGEATAASPEVDVTFGLGNLAFIGIGGGNVESFCLVGVSNLKGIGEKNEIFTNCCREDWLHDGLEKQKKIRRFLKKCGMQHTSQPVTIAKSVGA